jgi:outer membrane protein insertion porin family
MEQHVLMRRRTLMAFAAAYAFAVTSGVPADGQTMAPAVEGRTITEVVIRSDLTGRRDVEGARELLLSLAPGERFTSEATRQTLLNLQGSGLFSEVEIYARPVGGLGEEADAEADAETGAEARAETGVEVTIVAWANIMVEELRIEGEVSLRRGAVDDVVLVGVGRPLIESQVVRSVYALIDRHREDGFFEVLVRPDVQVDYEARAASVVFQIESGPRSKVGSIKFEGDLGPVTPEQLRGAMESAVDDRYWPQRVRRDVDRLQQFLFRQGHRTARVNRPVQEYDWDTHRMHLTYEIELGPIVQAEVIGANRNELSRAGLLPFIGVQGFDLALVNFSVRRIRSWYQSEGHYHAVVEQSVEESEKLIEVEIRIDPGPRMRLVSIRFEGNDNIKEELLLSVMRTSERKAFTPASGTLVDDVLVEDLRNLRSYYALRGFGEARIGPEEIIERPSEKGVGELDLVIPIDEGPRRTVGEVRWEGNEAITESSLAENLELYPDGPFHELLLDQATNRIRARYRDQGFERVLTSSEVEWNEEGNVADVTFRVLEGQRTTVRRVVVRGQQHTSPWMLSRAIDLEAGDPVSRSTLLDIQRRLYGLGVFSRVDVDLAQGRLLGGERDVVIRLEEGERFRLSLGGGYNTEDGIRALFGYSAGNLFGRAASLHLDAIVSQREEIFRLLLLQPAIGGFRFPLRYSLFRTREEETNLSSAGAGQFISIEQGLQVDTNLKFTGFRVPLLYTYKDVENNASRELDEILFDRERSEVQISSITSAVIIDRRDNPINPRSGRNTVAQLEWAFPLLSADEEFLKLFLQQTNYLNLGSWGIVGASIRLGGIESFRGDAEPQESDVCGPDSIPDFGVALSERYFAGGRSTHRSYKLDTLGILGETLFVNRGEDDEGDCVKIGTFTTGGNGLAIFNLELRYPFYGGFWATGFFDTGNIWADWRDIDFSDFKNGVGVGVGWDSPVGPIRVEIGWKLDREEFESPYQVFLSFGTAF